VEAEIETAVDPAGAPQPFTAKARPAARMQLHCARARGRLPAAPRAPPSPCPDLCSAPLARPFAARSGPPGSRSFLRCKVPCRCADAALRSAAEGGEKRKAEAAAAPEADAAAEAPAAKAAKAGDDAIAPVAAADVAQAEAPLKSAPAAAEDVPTGTPTPVLA